MNNRQFNATLDAIMDLEGNDDLDDLQAAKHMQLLIEAGTVWSLQGSYGRSAMDALESGNNMLGKNPAHDYYGNYIPSRDEVKPGTKGSRELVVQTHGEDWAVTLEMV